MNYSKLNSYPPLFIITIINHSSKFIHQVIDFNLLNDLLFFILYLIHLILKLILFIFLIIIFHCFFLKRSFKILNDKYYLKLIYLTNLIFILRQPFLMHFFLHYPLYNFNLNYKIYIYIFNDIFRSKLISHIF